jgi:hypothetical protein
MYVVIARSEATKQSMPQQAKKVDCFASLAMTGAAIEQRLSRLICPTGQLPEFPSSHPSKNISLFQKPKSDVCFTPSRA